MQSVVFTPFFERQAKQAGLTDWDIQDIASFIAANPLSGDMIEGTGGARKTRFARSGTGKSGGFRTIHYYAGDDIPLFLLHLIDKRRKANLSQSEKNELSSVLSEIVKIYREGSSK